MIELAQSGSRNRPGGQLEAVQPGSNGKVGRLGTRDRWRGLVLEAAAALGLPLVLFALLRPEAYGLTPNGLDPAFYTGYAMNFDDVLNAVGDGHYFVSRWSAYYPNYLLDIIAGPSAGRLLLRLFLSSAVLLSIWSLRRSWSWGQRILIGTLALSLPMFVRAFLTDYPEYIVVSLGICLVCLALRERQSIWSGLALGSLAGLMVVANPLAVTVAILPIAAAVGFGARGWRDRSLLVVTVAAGGVLVLGFGWLWFRWRYGIPNVYQPTVDFVVDRAGVRDPLKSPRLDWMGRFTWLYSVPILLVGFAGLALLRKVRLGRTELVAIGLCATQYAYQWFDQFVRDGDGLEISYYWSYVLPATIAVLALAIGRVTKRARTSVLLVVAGAWCALMLAGVPQSLRLPAGLWFVVVVLVAIGVAAAVTLRIGAAAGGSDRPALVRLDPDRRAFLRPDRLPPLQHEREVRRALQRALGGNGPRVRRDALVRRPDGLHPR